MDGLRFPFSFGAEGVTVSVPLAALTTETPLPVGVMAVRTKFYRVAYSAAGALGYPRVLVMPTSDAVNRKVDAANGIMLIPTEPLIMNLSGYTHLSHTADVVDCFLNITPLENG
jgi:hypothetical protein